MIDTLKIISSWEKDGFGMFFCKEGSYASIVTAFKLKGINYLYLSREERENIYRDIYDILDSLPTSAGKKRWYFQFYGCPEFEFDDVYLGMENNIFVNNEYKETYERLVDERVKQLEGFVEKKEAMRYSQYLVVRTYPGSGFTENIRDLIRDEYQIFKNDLDSLDDILEDFERIESFLSKFSPKRMSLLNMSNLLRRHYGLSKIHKISDEIPILPQIFTKEIEFNPDHTRVIFDNDKEDIYLRTYTASSYSSISDFVGLAMFDFPGDFSVTQSFTIPDNRRTIFLLKAKMHVKEIINSIPVLSTWIDKIKERKYIKYIVSAIDNIHETGEKRVKVSFHLTLRSNSIKDKRTRTSIRRYFNEIKLEELYEHSRHDMVNISSATPVSLSKGTEHTLNRFMTLKMSEFSKIPLLFAENEGADRGFVDFTTQGIFKIDPQDPRLKAKHQMTIGPTGTGKTFRKNRELTLMNMMNVSSVSISSKEEDARRTTILGGIHYDLSLDGTTKLSPFNMPERARKDDNKGRQLFFTATSHMLDFLQNMTGNYEPDISFKYQKILKGIFKLRSNASVSRVCDEIRKEGLMKESEALARFTHRGLWGGLFDDEKETGYELDIYSNNIISINTKNIKNTTKELFDLVVGVLMKKTIDIAAKKKGTTFIALDEIKDMLKDPKRAMLVATMFSEFRSFDAICSIYDQDAAFLEDGKVAKIIRANAPRLSILGINEKDHTTAKILGLNTVEEEICRRLKQKPGHYAELYTVYNFNDQSLRQKVYGYTTPTEYAINTTEPKDCALYDYMFEKYLSETKDSRYAHILSVEEFSNSFPHGVKQHPKWKRLSLKHKDNPIDFFREIQNEQKAA